jgi:hypothetical protein
MDEYDERPIHRYRYPDIKDTAPFCILVSCLSETSSAFPMPILTKYHNHITQKSIVTTLINFHISTCVSPPNVPAEKLPTVLPPPIQPHAPNLGIIKMASFPLSSPRAHLENQSNLFLLFRNLPLQSY